MLGLDLPVEEWAKEEGIADEEMLARIERRADEHMAGKVAQWGPDVMRYVEKSILLQTLDHLWREHLVMLEHLRQVIGLRGYGQRDPLNEYKAEAFSLFEAMSQSLREAVTAQLMRVEIVQQPPAEEPSKLPYMEAHKIDPTTGEDEMAPPRWRRRWRQRQWRAAERNPNDPRAGARSAATNPARAARARNTSTATASSLRAPPISRQKNGRVFPAFFIAAQAPAHRVHGASGGLAIVFAHDTGRGSPTPFAAAEAEAWLAAFEAALRSRDAAAAAALFQADGLWRDVLAFTWTIETMAGRPAIEATLRQTFAAHPAHEFPHPADARRRGASSAPAPTASRRSSSSRPCSALLTASCAWSPIARRQRAWTLLHRARRDPGP